MIKHIAVILSTILLICLVGCSNQDLVLDEAKTYDTTSEIKSLDIRINAADFKIEYAEKFSVVSNLKNLEVDENNGTLTLKDLTKVKLGKDLYNDAMVTIYIPEGTVFESINLTTGAGRLTIDRLSAATMNLELGAGEVTIDTLIATSNIDIDGGAGKITISGGALHNLDLDMGAGQLNLTSVLTGKSDFDLGIGESNITVIGNKDDYKLDIEKGIGNITVDGTSVSNIKGQGNGNNDIEIRGGIGAINLKFGESEAK